MQGACCHGDDNLLSEPTGPQISLNQKVHRAPLHQGRMQRSMVQCILCYVISQLVCCIGQPIAALQHNLQQQRRLLKHKGCCTLVVTWPHNKLPHCVEQIVAALAYRLTLPSCCSAEASQMLHYSLQDLRCSVTVRKELHTSCCAGKLLQDPSCRRCWLCCVCRAAPAQSAKCSPDWGCVVFPLPTGSTAAPLAVLQPAFCG